MLVPGPSLGESSTVAERAEETTDAHSAATDITTSQEDEPGREVKYLQKGEEAALSCLLGQQRIQTDIQVRLGEINELLTF